MKYRRLSLICILAVFLVVLLSTGSFAVGIENELSFDVNENGETYGDYFQIIGEGLEPDLILAQGDDGILGYVKTEDLIGTLPESPEAALALQAERETKGYKGHYINLYASDGTTVVGRFFIDGGSNDSATIDMRSEVHYGAGNSLTMSTYTVTGWSTIQSVPYGVGYSTIVQSTMPVSPGYLGGLARLYSSDGVLLSSNQYEYSKTTATYFSTSKLHTATSGYYYSYGIGCAWNPEYSSYGFMGLPKTTYCSPG